MATTVPASGDPAAPAPPAAVPAAERIELLDALRGFALFGILLANILYWSGWIFMPPADRIALAGAAGVQWQHVFHHVFVDGKFYTLFSLLFGMGFSLQLDRLERRGVDGVRLYRRRLWVLLVIGLVHMMLVWDGDILALYALLGFLLPLFRRWRERDLVLTAAALILSPLVGVTIFQAFGWEPHRFFYDLGNSIGAALGGTPGNEIAWLQREDPQAFLAWLMGGWPYRPGTFLESWRIPKVLGIMLLGLALGRRLADGRLFEDRWLMGWTFVAGLAVGIPLSWIYATTPDLSQASVPAILGTVPLALAYGAGFVLLWPHARPLLASLAAPGRMALTNYLAHSLLGILIFYGIGFGLVGRVSPVQFYAIAVAIFVAQTGISRLWLARFEQGPMERLWRIATYGGRRPAQAR